MKAIFKLAMLSMAMTFSFSSCQTDDDPVNNQSPVTKADSEWFVGERTWNFPYDLNTDEGQAFLKEERPYQETIKYFNIPDDVLAKMGTPELVQLCADWPWKINLTLFNSPREGYESLLRDFNGYRALTERKDNAENIIAYLKWNAQSLDNMKPESMDAFDKGLQIVVLSMLLGEDAVLDNMSPKTMEDMLHWSTDLYLASGTHGSMYLPYTIVSLLNRLKPELVADSEVFSSVLSYAGAVSYYDEKTDTTYGFIDELKAKCPDLIK